jgi:hypothetical protein
MEAPATHPDTPEQIDLYCLQCGYNLRGLSGEPRRCPECFPMNPVGDLVLPAERIAQALRQLQTAPTVCVAAICVGLPFLMLVTGLVVSRAPFEPGGFACILAGTVIPAMLWIICASEFRASCTRHPQWFAALMRYHLYGLLLGIIVFAGVIAVGSAVNRLILRRWSGSSEAVVSCVTLLILVAAIFLLRPLARRITARAADEMTALHRAVAVRVARDELRRELARRT